MRGRTDLIDALTKYFEGHIAKHKVNINNLLDNHVALAEHPDIIETLDKEMEMLSSYEAVSYTHLTLPTIYSV